MENPGFFRGSNQGFDIDQFLSKNKFTILLIIIAILILPNIVILVGAGQRAVVFNRIFGMERRVLEEGVQLVIPIIQEATIYSVREISYIFSDKSDRSRRGAEILGNGIETLTADGQKITVDVTVRARPDFKDLWWLHQNLGNDSNLTYAEKIIAPMVKSVVREVISGYTVSAIYSEDRRAIADKIAKVLGERLSAYKIVVSEFLLDEVNFSEAYQKAIEEKQKARIELDTKDNVIVEEENKRDAIVTKAQGEAEAIGMKVDSLLRNPSYLNYRKAQILGKRTELIFSDVIQ